MNDPVLILAVGFLGGKISIKKVSLRDFVDFCHTERPTPQDSFAHTTPDETTIKGLRRLAEDVVNAYRRGGHNVARKEMESALNRFGEGIANGNIGASNIAKLCGTTEEEFHALYQDWAKKNEPPRTIH